LFAFQKFFVFCAELTTYTGFYSFVQGWLPPLRSPYTTCSIVAIEKFVRAVGDPYTFFFFLVVRLVRSHTFLDAAAARYKIYEHENGWKEEMNDTILCFYFLFCVCFVYLVERKKFHRIRTKYKGRCELFLICFRAMSDALMRGKWVRVKGKTCSKFFMKSWEL
jgi:hypothetical protein